MVSLVLGSMLVLGGLGLAGTGATLVAADQLARDADGFMMSPREQLASEGFAITSEDAQINTDDTITRLPDAVIGDVRVSAEGAAGAELFVGIGPSADVAAYLADVRHDTLLEVRDGDPLYRSSTGGAPDSPPAQQDFWVADASGADPRVTWTLEDGDWTVVLMNADGSAAVSADVSAGAEVPMVSTVIAVLFVLAGLALLIGALLIAIPVRSVHRRPV